MLVWLKANQSDRTSCEFVGVHNDERDILGTILVVIISLTSCVTDDPEKKE